MASSAEIDNLRRILFNVAEKLKQFYPCPPSERNSWWRQPIPGVPDYNNFNSFRSLHRRVGSQWRFQRHRDTCVSDCYQHDNVEVKRELRDASVNTDTTMCENNPSVNAVNSFDVIGKSVGTDTDSDVAAGAVMQCDRDTIADPVTTSSPVKEIVSGHQTEQLLAVSMVVADESTLSVDTFSDDETEAGAICDRDTILPSVSNVNSFRMGLSDQPLDRPTMSNVVTVQPWSFQDKKPPDVIETTASHSIYKNVFSVLFGVTSDRMEWDS